ncbi:hypothetical protein GCM10018954_040390 [Kutzneria kofuensis]
MEALRAKLIQEYEDTLCNPYVAAERGYVDSVIRPPTPAATSPRALRTLREKRKRSVAAQEAWEHPL